MNFEILSINGETVFVEASTALQAVMFHCRDIVGIDGPWCVMNLQTGQQFDIGCRDIVELLYYDNHYGYEEEEWQLESCLA